MFPPNRRSHVRVSIDWYSSTHRCCAVSIVAGDGNSDPLAPSGWRRRRYSATSKVNTWIDLGRFSLSVDSERDLLEKPVVVEAIGLDSGERRGRRVFVVVVRLQHWEVNDWRRCPMAKNVRVLHRDTVGVEVWESRAMDSHSNQKTMKHDWLESSCLCLDKDSYSFFWNKRERVERGCILSKRLSVSKYQSVY